MAVTDTTYDGLFKDRYVGKLESLLPDHAHVIRDVGFSEANRTGDEYVKNVRTRHSNGYTFYGTGLDAFDLNSPVTGQTRAAKVRGSQLLLREVIAYGALHGATDSMQAFGNAFDETVLDMVNSSGFALELAALYGGSDIGEIASVSGSSTTRDWVITEASWAPGIWAKAEGMALDVYDAAGGTKQNTNADVLVTGVDFSTRTVSVSGDATDLTAIAANDVLIPKGADGNWFDGLDVLVPQTSGSMHGIALASNSAMKGNSVSAGSAPLTFATLGSAAAIINARSGMGDTVAYVSPFSYEDLNDDVAALRRYTSNERDSELGSESLTYHFQTGKMTIKSHPMVKAGEAFVVTPKFLDRIGSTDTTFDAAAAMGAGGASQYVVQSADKAGLEVRCYWNQALLNCRPPSHCKITAIVNNSL